MGRANETPESEAVLDDIEARPGSTVSLLRTFVGLYLRDLGGWIATRDLVTLMRDVGVAEQAARNGIARLKAKQLLIPDARGSSGYQLNPRAHAMLESGDRRIFTVKTMRPGDAWCLISFTVAERRRDVRHQLRRRLQFIGCGTVAPGLWIAPATLSDEVRDIAETLGIDAVLFETQDPTFTGRDPSTLRDAVATWWDLRVLSQAHHTFLDATNHLLTGPSHGKSLPEAHAFASYLTLIDQWRPLPYVDPGLADELLPKGWPGHASAARFATLRERFELRALEHVQATLHTTLHAAARQR